MFVVVGEALVDLVGHRGSRTLTAHPGGSPANVALGLARLGDDVTLMTRLGREAFGETIAAHLRASGVRVAGGSDEDVALQRRPVAIELVDTVGAGDSFTSGLLDALGRMDLLGGSRHEALAAMDESTLAGLLDAAGLVAAMTCSRPGADPPTRAEVSRATHHVA